MAGNAFSFKSCADFGGKNPDLRRKEGGDEDVGGFYKTRAFAPSRQPLSEMGLQQDQKRLGFADEKGGVCQRGGSTGLSGWNSLPEKIVVAVDVDEDMEVFP